jgi:hypothetical protein
MHHCYPLIVHIHLLYQDKLSSQEDPYHSCYHQAHEYCMYLLMQAHELLLHIEYDIGNPLKKITYVSTQCPWVVTY